MPGMLNRFRIEGLHNRCTIDVTLRDNRLVLIGENGAGKSTVSSIIYLFLTQQWDRMEAHYDFKSITATIDSEPIEISKDELSSIKLSTRSTHLLNKLSPRTRENLLNIQKSFPIEILSSNTSFRTNIALQYNISPSLLREFIDSLQEEPNLFSQDEPGLFPQERIVKATQILKTFTDKVLYLPTYRRIEQDLAEIFPGWEQSPEFKRTAERLRYRGRSTEHIELVEFGMQDVEDAITRKLRELKDSLGTDLSKLTSTYLRDVVLGVYQTAESSEISKLDNSTLNTVFNRIDKAVLPPQDRTLLRQNIEAIKTRQDVDNQDKVIIHFLTKLIEIHKNLQGKEKDVLKFVDVCNQYLSGKEFVYDNTNFSLSIHLDNSAIPNKPLASDEKEGSDLLKMSKLSSGEKQIVSLFSQIYLSGDAKYFVIIDEPELSLSVPWQKRFLPDILNSGRCNGLIAVTHSPFIFDNELDEYTKSLDDFMEPLDARR